MFGILFFSFNLLISTLSLYLIFECLFFCLSTPLTIIFSLEESECLLIERLFFCSISWLNPLVLHLWCFSPGFLFLGSVLGLCWHLIRSSILFLFVENALYLIMSSRFLVTTRGFGSDWFISSCPLCIKCLRLKYI